VLKAALGGISGLLVVMHAGMIMAATVTA